MGKLKQHLPPGVAPDNFFSSCSLFACPIHEWDSRNWQPHDSADDRYLVDAGATPWALFLATKILAHLVPFSKGQMGSLSPLGASLKKLCNFKANFSHPVFCKPLVLVPFWALTFWENSKSLLFQRSTKYSLLALQQPQLRFQSSCLLHQLLNSLLPYTHM